MRRGFFVLILLLSTVFAMAQRVKTVEGAYTYHAPENVTLEQAKRTALDRAMIQALADEFGTIVSQYNATSINNTNGQSSVDFSSIGSSDVKGEWIETIGTPTYNISYEGDMLVVSVMVKGKAREIVSADIDIKAHILRNGTDKKFESDQFKNNDDLYLSFLAPASGYLAVYLVDDDQHVFCLLPYRNQTVGIYPISANQRYLFFHEKSAPQDERTFVDEYTMTCERSTEHNQIYIIFSPNSFVKAIDDNDSEAVPRQLSLSDFNRWLAKCRKRDKDMTVQVRPITITK